MKKITAVFLLIIMVFSLVSCDIVAGIINPWQGDTPPSENNKPEDDQPADSGQKPGEDENPDDNNGNEDNPPSENHNPELIKVSEIRGLNEQIWISLAYESGFEYKILYKSDEDTEYLELDSELMIAHDDKID